MKTLRELAAQFGVSKIYVRKLYVQGRLTSGGVPAVPERHGNVLLFPDDTTLPERAAYGSLTPEQRAAWMTRRERDKR